MRNLVIIGAGGFGRELLQWVKDINNVSKTWNIKGFIDDNLNALDSFACDYKVINTIDKYKPELTDFFALAIATPKIKEIVVKKMKEKGAIFASIIHPTALIGEFNQLGDGLIMYPRSEITVNVKIGDFVTILSSSLGHDSIIEDYVTISSWCDITGGVYIKRRAYLASGVKIIPNKCIGQDAFLCAGSIVFNDIKDGIKVMGYPARKFGI